MSGRRATVTSVALIISAVWLASCGDAPDAASGLPAVRCFGTSDFAQILTGVEPPDDAIERLVGGPVRLPRAFPNPVSQLEAGVVSNSLFPGPPGYVIDFSSEDATGPSGQVIFAQQPVCEISPTPPEVILYIGGRPLYTWVNDVNVAVGARGAFENEGLYIDMVLAWPKAMAPDEEERLTILSDWMKGFIP